MIPILSGALFLLPTALLANPTGGAVAAGSATIAGQGTGAVTIHQTSNIAIINWQTFSINSGESTSFVQPGANSAALNRVLGGGTSLINGTLSANGQVYLINGNGIIVGPGGVINASAFTASTRDITDAHFLSGKLQFTGSGDAGVQNLGTINALGGNVVLIGRTVDNEGTITAPHGTAGLIAGDDVLLAQNNPDGSTITVSPASVAPQTRAKVGVKNGGTIRAAAAELKAANGNIYAMAVQNQGTIRATTVSRQGGHIWLTSDSGKVSNSGTLDASATVAGGKGGTITLKSATGMASHTGQIIAKGGAGGVGGNAEISGAQLQFTGSVDLTASNGTRGNLILDPTDVDIVNGGGTDITAATIDPSAIVSALDSANVTLTASNSITVNDTVDASSNANPGNLILDAPILSLNAPISLNGTLSGTATSINITPGGSIQNGVDAAGTSATISLANGALFFLTNEIVINKSIDIEGNGANLTGNGSTRLMEIDNGSVTLNNLVFQGGSGVLSMGATGNANGDGGALLVFGEVGNPNVSITNSTFVGNSATNGAAIFSDVITSGSAGLVVENSTFTSNTASNLGSAIFIESAGSSSISLGLKADTIALNSGGGAIYAAALGTGAASVSINDTILAGNMQGGGESDYLNGGGATLNDGGYNLFGQNEVNGGFPGGALGDTLLIGSIFDVVAPLGLFGGLTPTLPLVEGSPALQAGDPAFLGSADQRGITRGSMTQFTDGSVDVGAYAAQFVSVQADPISVTYGDMPTLTYTVTNGPAALISGTPMLFVPATNAGVYSGSIGQGSVMSSSPQYIVDFTNGDLTITPRSVVVLPDSGQGKVYGSPDPTLTYSVMGLINGDTLTGSPGYQGQGELTAVGNYQTTLGTVADPSGNYTVSLSAGAPTFAITPAVLFYAADPIQVPTGGTEFPQFTGTVVGFIPGDTQANSTSGSLSFITTATPSAPQGYYEIDGGGLSSNNYVFQQAATNIAALQIGNPPPMGSTPPGSTSSPTTPAETQAAASQPNTPVSQSIAQSSAPPPSTGPSTGGSNDPDNPSGLPGGTATPIVQNPPPATVDINVTSISPNESIDSTPPSGGGGGQEAASGGTDTTSVAQGSSFDPFVGATAVTVGQTVTVGGTAGAPPPPVVQAQLNQILNTGALDSLTTALTSATSTDTGGDSTPAASSTSSTTASSGGTPGTDATAAAAGGGSFPNPAGPNASGPVTVIAAGQTLSISGGKAAAAGPPPASVQTSFDKGFSSDSRDSLAKAAGIGP